MEHGCSYDHELVLINVTTTTTVLRPFVRDYPGEPVPEETLTTHHPFSQDQDRRFEDQDQVELVLSCLKTKTRGQRPWL